MTAVFEPVVSHYRPVPGRSMYNATRLVSGIIMASLFLYVTIQVQRPEVLLVGDVTIDVVPDGSRPAGGSITYAAAALNAMGIRACVVTVAGLDADLNVFAPHEVHVVPSPVTLTFEHSYTWWGHQRNLRVTADPNITLSRHHVPKHCQRARLVVLGPLVLHDVDAGSFLTYDSLWDRLMRGPWQRVVYMSQGAQRRLGPRGVVTSLELPSDVLLAGLGPQVSMFMSEVETGVWPAAEVARVARRLERLVITQGDKGAEEWNSTGVYNVPVFPVDNVVDTNGAGDTFAIMYGLAMAWGHPDPSTVASFAAGLAVQQPQACKPGCVGHSWAHLAQPWSLRAKLSVDIRALIPHLTGVAAAAAAPAAATAAKIAAVVQAMLLQRLPTGLQWPAVPQPIWPLQTPGMPPPPPLKVAVVSAAAAAAAPSMSAAASLLKSFVAAATTARQGGRALQVVEDAAPQWSQYGAVVAAASSAPPLPGPVCHADGSDLCNSGGAVGHVGGHISGCSEYDRGLEDDDGSDAGVCPVAISKQPGTDVAGALGHLRQFVAAVQAGFGRPGEGHSGEGVLPGGEGEER